MYALSRCRSMSVCCVGQSLAMHTSESTGYDGSYTAVRYMRQFLDGCICVTPTAVVACLLCPRKCSK
jgi:hypothetical protein